MGHRPASCWGTSLTAQAVQNSTEERDRKVVYMPWWVKGRTSPDHPLTFALPCGSQIERVQTFHDSGRWVKEGAVCVRGDPELGTSGPRRTKEPGVQANLHQRGRVCVSLWVSVHP